MNILYNLTIEDKIRITAFITNVQTLLNYDSLWTEHLESIDSNNELDVSFIVDIINKINHELIDVENNAQYLRKFVKKHNEDLKDAYDKFCSKSNMEKLDKYIRYNNLTEHELNLFCLMINDSGGIEKFANKYLDGIINDNAKERKLLLSKRNKIMNSESVDGDLSKKYWCYLLKESSVLFMFGIINNLANSSSSTSTIWFFGAYATSLHLIEALKCKGNE